MRQRTDPDDRAPRGDGRYLTFGTLNTLWRAGNPIVLPIQGEPPCRLQLDPKNGLMALVTVYSTPEPDVARLKNLTFQAVSDGANDLAELTIRVDGNVQGAYALVATIADELQLAKAPLAAAVASGVAAHKSMLAARVGLTPEREVGLFGELLFLEYLFHAIGAGPALASWQGPLSEEHDFVFEVLHLEVKSTSGERRRHVIHGLSQLVPLRGVPLSLLSIQVTRSSPDGGQSLPTLVTRLRKLAGGYVVGLDRCLDALGWKLEDEDLYPTCWTLRSQPRAYSIREEFPAMISSAIEPVVPNFALVSEVSYRVDLTDYPYDSLPDSLSEFVEPVEG